MKKYGEMDINKYREMNDSRITKGLRIIKREGPWSFTYRSLLYLNRCFLRALTPLVIALAPTTYFQYQGKKLPYFRHKKSLTWINERAIEIPIIMDYIHNSSAKTILEVGAVLPHYYPALQKEVIDKFEIGPGISNEDVVTFTPHKKYDLIVSISTLEHVGFDDDIKDPLGIIKALNNLKLNCLQKGGKMVITIPIGYNKDVDGHLFTNNLGFNEEYFFKKKNVFNTWKEISKEEAKKIEYSGFHAKAIVVGIIKNNCIEH